MHTPTKFWLYKAIGDSQIVSSNSLSVDHPKQSEFGRQRVHDHWQVSLSNLRMKKWKLRFRGNVGRGTGWNRGNWWWKKGNKNANKLKFCNLLFAASSIFISVCYISQNGFWWSPTVYIIPDTKRRVTTSGLKKTKCCVFNPQHTLWAAPDSGLESLVQVEKMVNVNVPLLVMHIFHVYLCKAGPRRETVYCNT